MFSRSKPETRRRMLQNEFVGALALLIGGCFVGLNVLYNNGQVSSPLDDTFIHLQYGRQIGEGQWFQYNDGDPTSTGASSFLYPILLGGGYVLGFHDTSLLIFAIGLGVVLFAVAAVLGCELGRFLGGERAGVWSGVLISTNGVFAWGATSGMEISLLAVLLLAALLAFVREFPTGRFLATPIILTLAALTRPEGLIFAVVLTGACLWRLLGGMRERWISPKKALASGLFGLLPLVAGAGQLLFYRLATGTIVANGVQAKSMFYRPVFYLTEVLEAAFSRSLELLSVSAGLSGSGYVFPGAVFFVVLGLSRLVSRGRIFKVVATAAAVIFVLVSLSVFTLETWHVQDYRYLQPLVPIFIVLAVVGMVSLVSIGVARNPDASRAGGSLYRGLIAFALVFSLAALPTWAVTKMGQGSAEIGEQQVSAGFWIRDNLLPGTRVAVNDAGAMRYYGEHPVVDLVGLVSNGFAAPYRDEVSNPDSAPASTYKALEQLDPEQRPDYFVIYPDWWNGFEKTGILGEELQRFALSREPVAAGEREVAAFKADWSLARSGDSPRRLPQGCVRDSLSIADLESEEDHDYAMRPSWIGDQPMSVLERLSYPDGGEEVVDGGRTITGGESFTARNLISGRPLTIAMRTTEPFALRVLVDGEPAGEWYFEPEDPDSWSEPSITVPADRIRSDTARIDLSPLDSYRATLPNHTPYRYWFVQ